MSRFEAGLDGVTFTSEGCRLLGGLYRAAGEEPRPTAVLAHGTPGIEKHLDIAYALRDLGWNCLYFHFRGSWGSEGSFSFAGLADDMRAAVDWVLQQPSVDKNRVALIGASMGGHAALLLGADDSRLRALVSISPLVEPRKWELPTDMADHFATMLSGVTGEDLLRQWKHVQPLTEGLPRLGLRSVLLVTGDRDDLWPPSHYADFVAALPKLQWTRSNEADHAFSTCRPWLVRTVTAWLVAQCGR
jgi:uncharacterized protein